MWIFISCSDINVAIRIRTILGGPTSRPVPSSYPRNFITKNHNVIGGILLRVLDSWHSSVGWNEDGMACFAGKHAMI
jgi:hypothetical protein